MQNCAALRYTLFSLAIILILGNTGFTAVMGYGESTATRVKSRIPATNSVTVTRHTFSENLFQGMKNSDVVELQVRLRELGYFSFPTDTGYFGPLTRDAVMFFQAANNLPITGYVGPLTREILNNQNN